MIVMLRSGADASAVESKLVARGLWVERSELDGKVLFRVLPSSPRVERDALLSIEGVEDVSRSPSHHPRVDAHPRSCVVRDVAIGVGEPPVLMAGPCAVESEAQIGRLAGALRTAGAKVLRGGAFKPRTSPYSFRGVGSAALRWLRRAADSEGMLVVTEAMAENELEEVAAHADILQIGSRNMQNYALLLAAGETKKPILLKRGMSATVEEWLLAAEYCLSSGASSVIFCERGLRGFDPATRNLLDLGSVALLAHVHRLPVIVDPSHAVGRRDLVPVLARAAVAAGAAGVLIEAHDAPGEALSDGPQALSPAEVATLARGLFFTKGASHG